MGKALSKELKKYYKAVKSELICNKKEKNTIISSLKSDIDIKIEDGSVNSIEDVISIFGTPKSIASDYKISDITALKKKRNTIHKIIAIAAAIAILITAAYITYSLITGGKGGYVTISFEVD